MEKLKAYIAARGISQRSFARELGLSDAFVSQMLSGERTPGLEMAFKIERMTQGLVPAAGWVE